VREVFSQRAQRAVGPAEAPDKIRRRPIANQCKGRKSKVNKKSYEKIIVIVISQRLGIYGGENKCRD